MSEERSYKKPLIVGGGLVAAVGVGWLAMGLNGGKPRARTVKEALDSFRNPRDAYHAAKVKVMCELIGRVSVHSDELVARVADPDEPDVLARRKLLRTMSGLGKATLGDFAFAELAIDLDQLPTSDDYQATVVARELYEAGQLPELVQEAS